MRGKEAGGPGPVGPPNPDALGSTPRPAAINLSEHAVVFELSDQSTVTLRPREVRRLAAAADAIRSVFGKGECRFVRSRALGGGRA